VDDLVNASFEFMASLMIINHCRVLIKDQQVKGVSVISTIFFTIWVFWNLYYYPSLGQWWSFLGGVLMVFANSLWVFLMIRYRGKKVKQLKRGE